MNTHFDFVYDADSLTLELELPSVFAGSNLANAIDAIRTEQNRDAINKIMDGYDDLPDEFFDGTDSNYYDDESLEEMENMLQLLLAAEACVVDVAGITYDDWTFVRALEGDDELLDDAEVIHTVHILDQPYLAYPKR